MKRKPFLNNEQLKVIDTVGSNVVVSASAGAGKTTVLVERFIKRIIEDGIKPDEIMALTFTDAASENMKLSIKRRIDELLTDSETSDKEKNDLDNLKSVIDGIQVSTIHSFCLKLIKEYYFLLGIDGDRINNIIDAPTQEKLKNEAFKITIDNSKHYIENAGNVSNSIFSLDDFKKSLDTIVDVAVTCYDPQIFFTKKIDLKAEEFNDIDENIRKYYFEGLLAYVTLALAYTEEILPTDNAWKPIQISIQKAVNTKTYADLIEAIKKIPKLPPVDKSLTYFQRLRKELRSLLEDKIAPRLVDERDLLRDYNQTVDYNNYLLHTANDYYKNYESLKEKNNVLDFNDFEHLAYKLLTANAGRLAKKFKTKYKEIMIDEFQDTNDTQYEIISLITNNNLFVVGDIKQSIYRFRNANPQIMKSLEENSNFVHLNMSRNHRSSEDIVDFNNSFYKSVMNYYKNGTFVNSDIQEFAAKSVQSEFPPLLLLSDDGINKYDIFADTIKNLHHKGVPFKDIVVLTKTHNKKKEIKNVLLKNNIPCVSYDKESYLTTRSLDVLYSFLKYIINNEDLIAKCSILSSSIYKVSDEELLDSKESNFEYAQLNLDIENLKSYVDNNDIISIINYILNINNYYYNLTAQEKVDIDLFISELNTINVHTIYDLVNYIEINKELPGKEALVITNKDDAVKLMTIHSSKGLEFKHVLLLSESQTKASYATNSVLCDVELGIGTYNIYSNLKLKHSTIKRMAILSKQNIEDLLEYQRLFYVATTRAIESLYIIDEGKLFSNSIEYASYSDNLALLYARKGFTSYLLNELLHHGNPTYGFAIIDKIENPNKLNVVKETVDRTYVPTNIFKTNVIESKRASEFVYNIALKETFDFGNKIHLYFEHLNLNTPVNEEEIKIIFKANSYKVIKAVNNFINSPIIKKIKDYDIYREYGYAYKENGLVYRGSIDFLAIDKDLIYLIDYKSDKQLTKEELQKHYKKQVTIYKEILRKKYKQIVVCYLYSIELGEFIEM